MVWWQVILFPFAILYNWITRFRNHLYNIGYSPSFEFEVNTINIGNLSVGGTGKSPLVNFLIEMLLPKHQVATLSRGYGRKSRGFRVATSADQSSEVGDEPYLFFKRYGEQVTVAVSEDRAYAIPAILFEKPEVDIILLDDAYQHRSVKPGLNILLTRYDRPFYQDQVLPSGRLRESRSGASRADLIVVTKCPDDLSIGIQESMQLKIARYSAAPVFFTKVAYQPKVAFGKVNDAVATYVVVSGLAHNEDFIRYCEAHFEIQKIFRFPDHHNYAEKDINRIVGTLSGGVGLLTTEKDWVKLEKFTLLQEFPCFYVPIATEFLKDEALFIHKVTNSLKTYTREPIVSPEDQ